jgi:hypothetical protein
MLTQPDLNSMKPKPNNQNSSKSPQRLSTEKRRERKKKGSLAVETGKEILPVHGPAVFRQKVGAGLAQG